jgi:VanZ family protein
MSRTCRWSLVLIGIVLLGLTFSSPLSSYAARSLQHGWQLGHVLLFAIWVVLLAPFLSKRFPRPLPHLLIIIVASLLLGLAIEYLQSLIGRESSLRDLVFDLNGSLLALCGFVIGGTLLLQKWTRRILYTLTLLISIYAIAPLTIAVIDEIHMHSSFPLLASFNSPLETGRWRGKIEIVKLISEKGEDRALQVQLNTDHYSGVSLVYFPRDWRAYQQLQIELFNPGRTPLALTFRIHDDKHYPLGQGDYYDRYNRSLTMVPGWNSIAIDLADLASAPINRDMDLANIQALGLFSVDLPKARDIYLGELKLVI